MQEFLDSKYEELKLLSDFDIDTEQKLISMSVDDFYFHVWMKQIHRKDHG